jgi:hypothetical protein
MFTFIELYQRFSSPINPTLTKKNSTTTLRQQRRKRKSSPSDADEMFATNYFSGIEVPECLIENFNDAPVM